MARKWCWYNVISVQYSEYQNEEIQPNAGVNGRNNYDSIITEDQVLKGIDGSP